MACGDKFKYLAITVDGYNFDNPHGLVAIYADYAGWQQLAVELVKLAETHFEALAAVEDKRSPIPGLPVRPKWSEILDAKQKMIDAKNDLPGFLGSTYGSFSYATPIQEAQEVIRQALCVLELSDDAIVSYGEKPPAIPGVKPAKKEPFIPPSLQLPDLVPDLGKVALGIAAIGGLAYVVTRWPKRRPREVASVQRTPTGTRTSGA